jgi:hypothetical protein
MQCEKLRTKTEPFTKAEIKHKLDNERELLSPKILNRIPGILFGSQAEVSSRFSSFSSSKRFASHLTSDSAK